MPQYDVDLKDYWRVIKKRRTMILLMIFLVVTCSYGFAKFTEPIPLYKASSAIKIERSTSMADFFLGGFWSQSENLETHAYIITSHPVLEQTAQALGWLPKDISSEEIRNSKDYLSIIQKLKLLIAAEKQPSTNIINIHVTSKDANESALVANTVASAYRIFNIQEKNRQTFETKAFIREQLELTWSRLKQSEEELKAFKEDYSLTSLDDQTTKVLDQLYTAETEYENAKKEKEDIEHQLRSLGAKVNAFPKNINDILFSPSTDSPVYDLRVKLSDLLLKRQTLLVDFTEKHPQVVEIENQIQALIIETKKELNTLLSALEVREADLTERLILLREENKSLPAKALQLIRLQREVALQESLYSQLKTKHQETTIQESGKIEEVSIVKPALVPVAPFNMPSKMMIMVTGFIMGIVLSVVFAFGVEIFDTSIGTIEDVENLLQVPVVGVIPFSGKEEKEKIHGEETLGKGRKLDLVTHYDPRSLPAEAFRALRSNLQFMSIDRKGKSFLVTSAFVQEGKTYNAINLALSMAQVGSRVLLMETDLRKPEIHKTFGLDKTPGLTDWVLGNYPWEDIKNTITDVMLGDFELEEILRTPGLDNLNIVTAGTTPPNPVEILRSARFRELLQMAYKEYDIIFMDSPPILPVADSTEMGPLVDGVILVYTVGKIGRGVLKRAKTTLDNVNAKVWGVVLNNVRPEAGPDYFKYHTQYYYPHKDTEDKKRGAAIQSIQKWMEPLKKVKLFNLLALLFALALLMLGIFWKDLF